MLLEAAISHRIDEIKKALQKGEDVNQADDMGSTALMYVSTGDNSRPPSTVAMQFLIDAGAKINLRSKLTETTALSEACSSGSLKAASILISAGADLDLPGENNLPILAIAATATYRPENRLALCKLLVEAGAKIFAKDDDNNDALTHQVTSLADDADQEVSTFLIEEGLKEDPNHDYSYLAHYMASYGLLAPLKLLLSNGLDINLKDRFGTTLMQAAARENKTSVVKFLLKAGADFNQFWSAYTQDHVFPFACRKGLTDILDFIKKRGFQWEKDLNILAIARKEALRHGQKRILEYLKKEGIQIEKSTSKYDIPLNHCIEFGNLELFDFLLTEGADPQEKDDSGNTPLHYAAYYDRYKMLRVLLQKGVDLNALNNLDWNALMQAAANGGPATARFLIKQGIEINQIGKETGASALIIAATEGRADMVKILLDAKADPSIIAKNGRTAATGAKENSHIEVVKLFGKTKPHFKPFTSSKENPHCAFCNEALTQEMIEHNFCKACDAYYCDKHFPWSEWRPMDPTDVYPYRHAICPNGHTTSEH